MTSIPPLALSNIEVLESLNHGIRVSSQNFIEDLI